MDISNAREPALADLASFVSADPVDAGDPASAGSPSLPGDTITTSPLTFFGGVVEQIGKAMMNDASAAAGASPSADTTRSAGFDQAIGLLEGVIGLMSAYGDDPNAISPQIARLAASEPPSGAD